MTITVMLVLEIHKPTLALCLMTYGRKIQIKNISNAWL